jgi:transposase
MAYITRYSDAFKLEVVQQIESGRLSIYQARVHYGIPGGGTIANWLRRFGKLHLLSKTIRVEKPEQRDRMKSLEAENKQLKLLLADKLLERDIAVAELEVICEELGLDLVELKKKYGLKSLKK